MLDMRAAQSLEQKRETGRQITGQVLAKRAVPAGVMYFCYVATPQEIDTHAILRHALAAVKRYACRCACGARGEMSARRICAFDELNAGGYMAFWSRRILRQRSRPSQIDLVIAPALACDMQGYRLGYGGGYYDRFLCRTDAACMALCADARLLDRLPHEPFDRRCQWVITERRVLRTDEEQ